MVAKNNCPSFERCGAPLCPLDATSLEHGIWYADEDVCVREGMRGERWIAIQKRIRRQTRDHSRGYFTVAMLSALGVVGRAIRGIDADTNSAVEDEAAWIARKRRPPMSEAERQRRLDFLANMRKKAIRKASCNSDGKKVSGAMPDATGSVEAM